MNTFRPPAIWLLLAAVIAAAYQPIAPNELVWDDQHTVVRTEQFNRLDVAAFKWMFTTTLGGHYQPLTWLSFAADYHLWGGLSPAGIHLTNLVLHWLSACGFFLVCMQLLRVAGDQRFLGPAALTATLWWAVHPLRVESVAWATERRDVLSGFFLVTTVLFYLGYVKAPARKGHPWLVFAVACYVASLLAKAAGLTLPLVLLALDWFPLRRSGQSAGGWRKLLLEKVAFLVPAALVGLAALWAQSSAGALRSLGEHSVGLRLMQACYGIVFYLRKMLWPSNLLPLYEQDPSATAWEPEYLVSLAVTLTITGVLLIQRRRWPGLLAAWLAYVLLLLPVLGLAQSGPQIVADRYTYLAAMPWAVVIAWSVAGVIRNVTTKLLSRLALCSLFTMTLWMFVAQSRAQVRVWRDEYTLWSTVVQRAPKTGMAHANLASELNRRGAFAQAIEHAERALARLPGNRAAHSALGNAALQLGDSARAAHHLAIAVEIAERIGKPDPAAVGRLAVALRGLGRQEQALELYESLIARHPNEAEWEFQYGSFLASIEDFAAARRHLMRATGLHFEPAYCLRLAVVQKRLGEDREAVESLRRGLQAAPGNVELQSELAWILATTSDHDLRDGPQALTLAQAAVDASGGAHERAVEALAAAHAETGDFIRASKILHGELAPGREVSPARRERLQRALELYGDLRPYHE